MNAAKKQHEWTAFFKFYSEQNGGRPTRLGVFEKQSDIYNDYWLEAGLPFSGIDVDTQAETPTVEIMLGDLTHTVNSARTLKIHFSLNGDEDGIDILDVEGKTTILRFEEWVKRT
jgi:hypothetical protein